MDTAVLLRTMMALPTGTKVFTINYNRYPEMVFAVFWYEDREEQVMALFYHAKDACAYAKTLNAAYLSHYIELWEVQ